VFGTKMRSVVKLADRAGVNAIVVQQFEIGRQILAAGLVPILEPEVDIHSPHKAEAEGAHGEGPRLPSTTKYGGIDVIDEREIVRRAVERQTLPEPAYERLLRRRDRKRRNERLTAAVVAIAVFVGAMWFLAERFSDRTPTPASRPKPEASPIEGPFGQVGGWIAYSGGDGILAVNPARPERRIRLSRGDGDPVAW
jgi:hypothetical protein